jgi:hypothetical protein
VAPEGGHFEAQRLVEKTVEKVRRTRPKRQTGRISQECGSGEDAAH